jgi:hypothetical protein
VNAQFVRDGFIGMMSSFKFVEFNIAKSVTRKKKRQSNLQDKTMKRG